MDGSQLAYAGTTAQSSGLRGGGALGYACLQGHPDTVDIRRPQNAGLAVVAGQYTGGGTVDPTGSVAAGYRYSPPAEKRPRPVATVEPPPAMRTAEGSRRQVQVVEEAACPGYILTGPAHEPLWSRGLIGGSPSALSQDMGSPSGNAHGRPAPRRR